MYLCCAPVSVTEKVLHHCSEMLLCDVTIEKKEVRTSCSVDASYIPFRDTIQT